MANRILKKIDLHLEKIIFKIFKNILKKYHVGFYFKDELGIFSKRHFDDNFQYIFRTGNSCDAMPMMIALTGQIKGSKISIDVGANIGITAIWMAKNSDKVFAFEPEKNNLERLKENLETNHASNVEVIPKAVSNRSGVADLNLFNSYGHHSLSKYHVSKLQGTQRVETVALDDFCYSKNINIVDVLKIDVEGCECEVLQGAMNMLKDKRIKNIIFEHSRILLKKQKKDPKQVIMLLLRHGYKIYKLNHEEVDVSRIENLDQEDLYAI